MPIAASMLAKEQVSIEQFNLVMQRTLDYSNKVAEWLREDEEGSV